MLYAALGDSITYGYEATKPDQRFVSRLKLKLSKMRRVSVFEQAKPGWTSRQLLKSLPSVPNCIWEEAHIITVMVGGNDLLRAVPWVINGDAGKTLLVAEKFRDHLTQIIQTVNRPQNKVFLATIYNPFPNYLVAKQCTQILNQAVKSVAKRERVFLVDLDFAFLQHEADWIRGYKSGEIKDFKLRSNPIHPNDEGHEAIAEMFFKAYRKTFKSKIKQVGKERTR
jgi:lysophospholipase L1-like esterase